MSNRPIVIVGGGIMGSGILARLINASFVQRSDITVIEHNNMRATVLEKQYNVQVKSDIITDHISSRHVVFIAVKPQDARLVLEKLGTIAPANQPLTISVMAGVSLGRIYDQVHHHRVIRAMPNLAATVGEGVIGWVADEGCSTKDQEYAAGLFALLGFALVVNENDINTITAIAGSGPGYFYAFVRDFKQAALALGLGQEITDKLVRSTIIGAAHLYEHSDVSPDELVARVASKGGTTEAALEVLEQRQVRQAWIEALQAAYKRAHELSRF